MKRTTLALFTVLASLTMATPVYAQSQYGGSGPAHAADQQRRTGRSQAESQQRGPGPSRAEQQRRRPGAARAENQRRGPGPSRAEHQRRRPGPARAENRYRGQHGYSERPYNRREHFGRYRRDNRNYAYRGHWRSWQSWETYRMKHRDRFRDGRYYRQDGHLMFRFCDGGNCAFFSIGR